MPNRTEVLRAVIDSIVEMKPEIDTSIFGEDTKLYADGAAGQTAGLDSMDALELVTVLEQRFDLELSEEVDIANIQTLGHVVDAVQLSLGAGAHGEP